MSAARLDPRRRERFARAVALAVLAVCAGAIAWARPRAAATAYAVKVSSDVYALPPTEWVPAVSLGWRSALADLLFTKTIISYGIHGEEKRRFENVGDYLDAIIELDPTFRDPFRLADTLMIYHPVGAPDDEVVRHTGRILKRGLEAFPNDGYLWLSAGQFFAYIGPQFLSSAEEKKRFEAEACPMLERAGQLASDNVAVQWQALVAGRCLLDRKGGVDATIDFYEKLFAITDDDALRGRIWTILEPLQRERDVNRAKERESQFRRKCQSDLSFVSRTRMLVVGPRWDAVGCAGRDLDDGSACATTWAAWERARADGRL